MTSSFHRQPAISFRRQQLWLVLLAGLSLLGCSRAYYREQADAATYQVLRDKSDDPRWAMPRTNITPDPASRFYDPYDQEEPPLPPDDEAAHRYMNEVHGMRGWDRWHDFGDLDHVENPDWTVPLGGQSLDKGRQLPKIKKLTLDQALQLGLLHSRDYQEQLENVYLNALSLTFQRYRFDVRPRGFSLEPSSELFYQHQPDGASDLTAGPTTVGFQKLLPAGGQFIAELANNTLWMFAGPNQSTTATSLAYSIVQPMMATSGRQVALERLTQAERNSLYSIRDFARFRKDFYTTIVTGERALPLPGSTRGGELAFLIRGQRSPTVGYNILMFQLQRLRNQEANVRSLQRRVRELEMLAKEGRSTLLDVTQLRTSLENARRIMLLRRRRFANEVDRFKVQLGLPPDMELEIDDTLLKQFEFVDPALTTLEDQFSTLPSPGDQSKQLPLAKLLQGMSDKLSNRIASFKPGIQRLQKLLPERGFSAAQLARKQAELARDEKQLLSLEKRAKQTGDVIRALQKRVEKPVPAGEREAVRVQFRQIRRRLLQQIRELTSVGVMLRVDLITLKPVAISSKEAVQLALTNRLDLMNRRGFTVDARRALEIAGDRLRATLDIVAEGSINTPPLLSNSKPFDFRAKQSEFRAGLRFVTPLDRVRARNDFRAAQISFQRAKRNYIASEDQVKLDVRAQHREVVVQYEIFEINRRTLKEAARELDQAIEFAERPLQPGQAVAGQGVNISRALDNILDAQNELIENWVEYEMARLSLFRDIGTMRIGPDGSWVE